MSWEIAKQFLLDHVIVLISDPGKNKVATEWLGALDKCPEGKRLGFCMGIDVKSGSIEAELYSRVLQLLDGAITDSQQAFARACRLFATTERIIIRSRHNQSTDTSKHEYYRALTAAQFLEKFSIHEGRLYPDWDTFKSAEMNHHSEVDLTLSEWVNSMKLAWIMPKDVFDNIVGTKCHCLADYITNELGLPHFTIGSNVILFPYPDNAKFEYCSQPSALDNNWKFLGDFYLSYKKDDNFGRTHPLNGIGTLAKERVYCDMDNGVKTIRITEYGDVQKQEIDRLKLEQVAEERFLDA